MPALRLSHPTKLNEQIFASRAPQHGVCKLCRSAGRKDAQISLSDAPVDLTGASNAVVAGLLTEPPHSVAATGLLTGPLTVGSTIFVDLPEHGITADFTVREIRPCPTPMAGDGYLVTTKFIHENAEILDLQIEGSGEPIGTTASHPFWSEDRQQFVATGELRVGENLLLADDTTRRVESITLRPNRETVYNIEVDGEHVFYVGHDGVLVHNTCPPRHRKYHGKIHHLASDKDKLYGPIFKRIFDKGGLSMQSAWNRMRLAGHVGPHGKFYNRLVLDRLRNAVRGATNPAHYRSLLIDELKSLRRDIRFNGWDALLKAPASGVDVKGLF